MKVLAEPSALFGQSIQLDEGEHEPAEPESDSDRWLWGLYDEARRLARLARLHDWFPWAKPYLLRNFFGILPAVPEGSDGWDVVDPRASRWRQWRLIIPVLVGKPDLGWLCECDPLHGFPLNHGEARMEQALFGAGLVDLLAVDHSMSRPPRRLTGMASALGFGCDHENTVEGDPPVVLARDLRDWFARLAQGPTLLLGSPAEQQDTIWRFGGGVICADLEHGMAIERLMRRPIPAPPKILVAA